MSAPVWHLLSGELARGGIGDYTRLLADALADAGRKVHAWSPDAAQATLRRASAHPMRGVDRAALRELGAELDRFPAPRRLLVQYAPQAWGMRGMNVPFCRWVLARRRAGDDVRVMFHEPFFPFGLRQRPRRNLLAAVNRWMARDLLRASTRAYVSTAAWERLLRPLAPPDLPIETLPIPSTIPFVEDAERVAALRAERSDGGRRPVFVHFGTYGGMIAPMLREALEKVIEMRPDARILLLGRGGPDFAARLRSADPRFADALVALGEQAPEEVSLHLQAADVAIQPYPDGGNTRRTSLMACLANGVPTVTTRGFYMSADLILRGVAHTAPTELFRMGERAVELYDDPGRTAITAPDHAALRRAMRALYEEEYAVEHTVARLLADEGG